MNKKTKKNKGGENHFLQHLRKMVTDSDYKRGILQKNEDYKINQKIVENINKTPNYESECDEIINRDYNHLNDNEIDTLFILCNKFGSDKNAMNLYANMSSNQKKRVSRHVDKKDHDWESVSTISFALYTEKDLDEELINSMCIFLLALPIKKRLFYMGKFYDESVYKSEDYTGTDKYTDISYEYDVSNITFEYLRDELKKSEQKQASKKKRKSR